MEIKTITLKDYVVDLINSTEEKNLKLEYIRIQKYLSDLKLDTIVDTPEKVSEYFGIVRDNISSKGYITESTTKSGIFLYRLHRIVTEISNASINLPKDPKETPNALNVTVNNSIYCINRKMSRVFEVCAKLESEHRSPDNMIREFNKIWDSIE